MSTTPDNYFHDAFHALCPDLQPVGPIESMFVEKISRHTVLSDLASAQILHLDPADETYFKKFRQISLLIASYERIIKFAYTELRRLQTERAVAVQHADLYQMPRLARTAILTTGERVTKAVQTNQESLISIATARADADYEMATQDLKVEKARAKSAAA